jgi:DNA-binding Lrp family transcriptional regulator
LAQDNKVGKGATFYFTLHRIFYIEMTSALLLINCIIGYQDYVVNELKKLSEFIEVYKVNGIYDIIVKVTTNSEEELQEIMIAKIRKIEGITTTLTLLVVKEHTT